MYIHQQNGNNTHEDPLAAGIALASLIQPSRAGFPGCEAITKLTNQYKLQDGSLKGEQSFTLNTLSMTP